MANPLVTSTHFNSFFWQQNFFFYLAVLYVCGCACIVLNYSLYAFPQTSFITCFIHCSPWIKQPLYTYMLYYDILCVCLQEWEKLNYDIYTLRYARREVRSRWKKILLQLGKTLPSSQCQYYYISCCSRSVIYASFLCRLSVWGRCLAMRQQTEPVQSRPGAS